jgi:hypothetical protein
LARVRRTYNLTTSIQTKIVTEYNPEDAEDAEDNTEKHQSQNEENYDNLPGNNDTNEVNDGYISFKEPSAPSEPSAITKYDCYYCMSYQTNNEKDYERHIISKHPKKQAYPTKAELEKHNLTPQGKSWEV